MKIVIASYTDGFTGGEAPLGDRLLGEALERRGNSITQTIWSEPQIDWTSFDVVAIRSCWDYHLRPEAFLDWIASLETRNVAVLNSPALIRWNVDKRYLADLNVPIPSTLWLDEGQRCDIAALCREYRWRKAVVKPFISASAYKTELRSDGEACGPAMVQQFVEEIQKVGEWSLMYFGGRFSHAVLKRPAEGDFRVQLEFGGSVTRATPSKELLAFADRAMSQLPFAAALARVDIVDANGNGPMLMELEVIEPELFLSASDAGAAADAILRDRG